MNFRVKYAGSITRYDSCTIAMMMFSVSCPYDFQQLLLRAYVPPGHLDIFHWCKIYHHQMMEMVLDRPEDCTVQCKAEHRSMGPSGGLRHFLGHCPGWWTRKQHWHSICQEHHG